MPSEGVAIYVSMTQLSGQYVLWTFVAEVGHLA